jgi:RNA polymerase sigma-70 factor (ECF subfamily)
MDDQNIWSKIVTGDVDALRILHDKYYYPMWLWASKFTKDKTLAEELVSDCFIRLWERRQHIFIDKSLKSYLYLMLRNQIISQVRKSKSKLEIGLDNLPDLPDEVTFSNQDYYAALYRAIQKIPGQRRKILELAAFESFTYKEIASQLNISVNTVKTQMGRAYQFLKEELDPNQFVLLHFFLRKSKL